MLLQRLGGADPTVDGTIMYELTELAYVVDKATFADIVKSIYDISKSLGQDDPMTSVVSRLASRVKRSALTPDFCRSSLLRLASPPPLQAVRPSTPTSSRRRWRSSCTRVSPKAVARCHGRR